MRDPWIKKLTASLIGGLIGVYTPEPMWWMVLGIFLWVLLRIVFWRPRDFFGPELWPEILILCASILVGFGFGQTGKFELAPPLTLSPVQVVGELKDWSLHEEGAAGLFEVLEPVTVQESALAQKSYSLRVYFDSEGNLPEGWDLVRPGDTLEFTAKIEQPKPPGTQGQFDYPLYNAVRGLSGWITAQGEADILRPGNPGLSWRVRNHVQELLALYPQDQTGLLEGIVFGDTSRIPEEALESYRITGVYHVFSASGSNVAFLLLLCWNFMFFLPRSLRVGITIAVLAFYALLCGGNPPILRATIMSVFVLLGRLGKGRETGRANGYRGLLIAAFLLFIWQPLILKDIGFQLSFMATWGILVLSNKLEKGQWVKGWPKSVRSAFSMTCAAQIATLPLMISVFHRLSLIGILANLLVLFVLGSIFELGILAVFLSFIPQIALPLFQVSLWLLNGVSEFLIQLARLPWADVWVVNPGTLFWVCWYGWLLVLLVGKAKIGFILRVQLGNLYRDSLPWVARGLIFIRPLVVAMQKVMPPGLVRVFVAFRERAQFARLGIKGERILAVLLLLLFLWSPWNAPDVLQVTFIDVGQGDCILIETPGETRIMVDTGPKTGTFDAGEQVIVPYLLQRGIKRLDALILTHPHADHVGGAGAIFETIPVGWVGIPEDGLEWLSYESFEEDGAGDNLRNGWGEGGLDWDLIRMLEKMTIKRLSRGDKMALDSNITLTVIAPGKVLRGTKSDENNNSLVLHLENSAGQSVLLTGDMEEEQMEEICRSGQNFEADLLKIPHHGSRYSLMTEMLDRINPRAVVIPVGKNSFGHPSPQVLEYWGERQVPVYRTDEDGTIQIRFDEISMEFITGRD
ncbi:DNA internalization-related competence protein ComEC/Rec2 [Desulfitobacterium sp. PCE1]|uniref:DNA internalization-related competence protein ComEC/Rec2 n=1 Tax=Desulfitobacterium sp. PCE1 TaxID=146907 RepID=UPI00036BF841|nr:DNA internalization-related competence protein ComEC/Rec2 [Desulfitobacterium sp. PCE1]